MRPSRIVPGGLFCSTFQRRSGEINPRPGGQGVEREKVTVVTIAQMKRQGRKIVALTAYDYPFARLFERAGVDILLVGDSLGMVVLGYPNTLPVTMAEMIHHTRAVARGSSRPLLVADMPFMSFQTTVAKAVRNAGRLIKEGGGEAVKVEGGMAVRDKIRAMVDVGIPVMGHVGLTPQSVHRFGGYRVQGRTVESAEAVLRDARAVEEAGAFSVVLEGLPVELARRISLELTIPTIGIGAGPFCDGQILVSHDLLGLFEEFTPRFVKCYARLGGVIVDAVQAYRSEVESGKFPGEEHSFHG